jgi:hypothetical protein
MYKAMINGIAMNCNVKIKTNDKNKNIYFGRFFENVYVVNFKANKGISDVIK